MNQFARAKENGLTIEQEDNFDILRGCVMASHLENSDKRKLCSFIQDLQDYFEAEEEE